MVNVANGADVHVRLRSVRSLGASGSTNEKRSVPRLTTCTGTSPLTYHPLVEDLVCVLSMRIRRMDLQISPLSVHLW